MTLLAQILVGIVAVLHLGFLVLEMFWWNTPRGRATFGTTPEFAAESATLAANQGLYNGFLSAGLVWSLIAADPVGFQAKVFFLGLRDHCRPVWRHDGQQADPVHPGRSCGVGTGRGAARPVISRARPEVDD